MGDRLAEVLMSFRLETSLGVFAGIFVRQITAGIVLGGIGLTGARKMCVASTREQMNPLFCGLERPR